MTECKRLQGLACWLLTFPTFRRESGGSLGHHPKSSAFSCTSFRLCNSALIISGFVVFRGSIDCGRLTEAGHILTAVVRARLFSGAAALGSSQVLQEPLYSVSKPRQFIGSPSWALAQLWFALLLEPCNREWMFISISSGKEFLK